MDTVRIDDKVTIKKTKKTAVVAWIDDSKDHDNYLLEITSSDEMPKFYSREDFEPVKKDKLTGLDKILKDKQEEIELKELKKKLKSSGFAKEEIIVIIKGLKSLDNYLMSIRNLLQYLKDNKTNNKDDIVKEIYKIINK